MNRYTKVWIAAFDQAEDDAAAAAAAKAKADADANKADPRLEAAVAEERKKFQGNLQKALDEVNALRTKVQLTDTERKELDKRLDDMQKDYMTKEELSKREIEKLQKQSARERDELQTDREAWKGRYTNMLISSSIVSAASKHKAFNPNQVIAILSPSTRLEETVDAEGKPTGALIPKVDFQDKDKDGKPITLKLTMEDAVKRMADMDEFSNLFQNEGSAGIGHRQGSSSGVPDIALLAKDAAKYREAKAKGLIKL